MFEPLARILSWFYDLTGDYAASIALLTMAIMLFFTPITIRGARSMAKISLLQPEIKRIQAEHKGDRMAAQEEMGKLYRQHKVNPIGGCLPLLIQIPVFFILYQVIRGLSSTTEDGVSRPQYLDESSELYNNLVEAEGEMRSLGMDLARSAQNVLQDSFVEALPYLGLVGVTFVLAWLQQVQAKSRRTQAAPSKQMELLLKIMPFMLPVFSFVVQSGLAVYFVTSSVYRLLQQEYIHRTTKPPEPMPDPPPSGRDKELPPDDTGKSLTDPSAANPPVQRSQKALDAEAERMAQREARRAARRAGGSHVRDVIDGPADTGASRKSQRAIEQPADGATDKGSAPPQQQRDRQAEETAAESGDGTSPENASDGRGVRQRPTRKQKPAAERKPTATEGRAGRRKRGTAKEPETKPIQSRRTSGDGRRKNRRK